MRFIAQSDHFLWFFMSYLSAQIDCFYPKILQLRHVDVQIDTLVNVKWLVFFILSLSKWCEIHLQNNARLLLVAIRYTYLLLSQLAYYCLNGPLFSNYLTSKLTPLLTSPEFYFSFLIFPHDARFICKKNLCPEPFC